MKRRSEFVSHPLSKDFLAQINELVAVGEDNADVTLGSPNPLILVVGAPRSGTTVLMQWLQASGISVPSNIAARFPRNPYFAGLLQRLLSDPALNYRDELTIPPPDESFRSDYGKTRGPLSPHEFSFYIRRFFPVSVGERLTVEQLKQIDVAGFLRGLALFGAAVGTPVALKALLIQYHLELFADARHVIIVHVHRDEADNVCSLLAHRELVAGDAGEWISVRPPQYDYLVELAPVEQVAGQVHFTNREIEAQLVRFPVERVISLDHEAFCADPSALHGELQARLTVMGATPLPDYTGPASFKLARYDRGGERYRAATGALQRVARLAASGEFAT